MRWFTGLQCLELCSVGCVRWGSSYFGYGVALGASQCLYSAFENSFSSISEHTTSTTVVRGLASLLN